MSNYEFGHDHNKRDAWKKMSEWSHSVSDDELNTLFDEDEFPDLLDERERVSRKFGKFLVALFGLSLGLVFFSFVVYQLAIVVGVENFSFTDALIVTTGLAIIRYTDAGIIKQIR